MIITKKKNFKPKITETKTARPAKRIEPKANLREKQNFPDKFPFWARLKISKNRTTLVIDEEMAFNKKSGKIEDSFVHRESTHTKKKDYEEVSPNPDSSDEDPMYLKRPRKLPKRMFSPHNKELSMPDYLKERYEKNNKK